MRWLAPLLALALAGCLSLPRAQREAAEALAEQARSRQVDCAEPAGCGVASPIREEALARGAASDGGHSLWLLDRGPDALLARLHLIHSARRSIELQSFIFADDASGRLVLEALLQAARRGVRVRVLLDQLYGLPEPNLQAALAGTHVNIELRLYNPTFGEARTQQLQFAAGILCCFRRFNQRMHNKLLRIDGALALVGGRNVQDRYFDWDPGYNYRDRDLLVAGPAVAAMGANFDAFWDHPRTLPAQRLRDVAQRLLRDRGPVPQRLQGLVPDDPRVRQMDALARDGDATAARLAPYRHAVGRVDFYADGPDKHDDAGGDAASAAMRELVLSTREELLLQTPYLVFSRDARRVFRELHQRDPRPRVRVSTNSLAATDAFPVYAMSHKYKRLYLREFGFTIHEFKPFPLSAPIDLAATGAPGLPAGIPVFGSGSAGSAGSVAGPVPLRSAGVRVGLHAKSMVIDGRVAIVGSHNFDPRSDNLNTESLVVVHDAGFAAALTASIEGDMAPENAWLIGPRPRLPLVAQFHYNLGKLSERLPIFDIWPFPYATSYQLRPDCPEADWRAPAPWRQPDFERCWDNVGDFPEVDLPLKSVYTRILTAFGAGLVPIL